MDQQHPRCPVCKRGLASGPESPREERPYFPFCSERCRAVDLGRFLNEEYRVSEPLLPRLETEESND